MEKLGRFKPTFTTEQENELASHCKTLDECFYGLSFMDFRRSVYQYADINNIPSGFNQESRTAGKEWALSFMRRHNLSLRTPQQTSLGRMMGFNRVQVGIFFNNLREITTKYRFTADRIYNMDETGMSTVPNNVPKVVSATGKKAVGKISSGERGELVTAVCAISAQGSYVPPALIFKRKRQKPELMDGAPCGSKMFISDTGYINSDLFYEWVEHFQVSTKATKENPVLLILDNHSSHQSLKTVLYCRENGIVLLSIPPHSSHKVQPLDRCFFQALKTNYAEACNNWLVTHPGRVITQYQVAELFGIAYGRCASIEKAVNAFRMCGIVPINPGVFTDEDFMPSEVTNNKGNEENVDPEVMHIPRNDESEIPSTSIDCRKKGKAKGQDTTSGSLSNEDPSSQRLILRPVIPATQSTPQAANAVASCSNASDPQAGYSEKFGPLVASLRNIVESFEAACAVGSSAVASSNQDQRTETVPFSEIRPLPKRDEPQKRRKRGQKSEIITSTPFKERLELKAEEQEQKNSKSTTRRKKLFSDPKPPKKKVKIEKK